jgi:hypothetical protein
MDGQSIHAYHYGGIPAAYAEFGPAGAYAAPYMTTSPFVEDQHVADHNESSAKRMKLEQGGAVTVAQASSAAAAGAHLPSISSFQYGTLQPILTLKPGAPVGAAEGNPMVAAAAAAAAQQKPVAAAPSRGRKSKAALLQQQQGGSPTTPPSGGSTTGTKRKRAASSSVVDNSGAAAAAPNDAMIADMSAQLDGLDNGGKPGKTKHFLASESVQRLKSWFFEHLEHP